MVMPRRYLGLSAPFLITLSLTAASAAVFAPRAIDVPGTLRDRLKSFEPSTAIYLADLDRYLVGSDDTTKGNLPWLFLMDAAGRVSAEPVVVSGLKKMTDIESLSQEGDQVFLLSSLGLNKNDEEKSDRNLFVRAERKGARIVAKDAIDLRNVLLPALLASNIPPIKAIRTRVERELDVESHLVKDGILYVGLKNPQPRPGLALILNLGKVDEIFANRRISAPKVYAEIDFGAITGDSDALSDMDFRDGKLYFTSSTEGRVGRTWRYLPREGKLTRLRDFPKLNPEGIAPGRNASESLVLFDQGGDEGLFSYEAISVRIRRAH